MEFTPFDGELDKEPSSFVPFTGKLDDPSAPSTGGKEDELGDKSIGLLEAGAGLVAGMPSQIAGGLYGLGALVSGQGLGEAARRVEAAQESNFGMGRFKPSTKKGQEYLDKAGQLLEKPIDWAGSAGKAIGGDLGETNARVAAETLMNFMPLHLGVKGGMKVGKAIVGEPKLPDTPSAAVADAIAKKVEAADIRKAEQAANPVTAAMDPMERMAADLAPGAERGFAPVEQTGPMANMAENLSERRNSTGDMNRADAADAAARDAQSVLEERQRAMEQEVKQKATLDFNAAERARQEAAPTGAAEAQRASRIADAEANATLQPDHGAILQAEMDRLKTESERAQARHQMEIDDTQHVLPDTNQVYGDQYGTGAGVGRVDENGMPIRADRSIEAQQLQNPLQRNLWGDELDAGLGQTRSLTEALDTLERTPFKGDARDRALEALGAPTGARSFNERTRGQGGAISTDVAKKMEELGIQIVRVANGVHAVDSQGKVVGRLESNITPEQGSMLRDRFPNERNDASVDIVKVDPSLQGKGVGTALYSEWAKAHGGNVAPSGVTTQPAWNQWKRNYPTQVDTFVKGEAARLNDGANPEQVFSNIKDPDIANRVRIAAYEPGSYADPFKNQRGHIRIPGSNGAEVIKDNPLFRAKLSNFLFEKKPIEQIAKEALTGKDLEQNALQKAFNYGTKGVDYMVMKSDNPIIKATGDAFKEATDIAAANQRSIVHEIYAPTLRKLSKKEFTETWDALKQMEAAKTRLTDDELVAAGFNGKQRDAIKMHQEVMDSMVGKINETLDAMGMSHIDPEAAYVAAKASGNFRRLMMKEVDGELRVVGAIGGRTRGDVAAQIKKFQEHFPDTIPGEEQVYKGSAMRSTGFDDVMSFLSANDPLVAEYLKQSRDVNYLGSRTHLMDKKGIPGMAGSKPWESPEVNAREGFDAQVRYLNTMLEWAEKAKAAEKVRPLLDDPAVAKAQPNAVAYAKKYQDMALGVNPTAVGKGVEQALAGLVDSSDGWSSYVGDAASLAKKATNYKLLTMRPGYLLSNLMQAGRTMPELAQFLSARGARDTGFGISSMVKGLHESAKANPEGIFKDAVQYADSHHVYASDLLMDSDSVRNSVGHVLATAAQKPAAMIEQWTRKSMFMGLVDILHKNGVKPEEGLFQAAHKLTDMGMNRYTQQDAPLAVGAAGPLGKLPYNLMSYKFNELSRFAMLAREAFNNPTEAKYYKPVATAMLAQVMFAGLSGAMFFKEADWLVRQFSNMLDKPTSLTKILLDNGDEKLVGPVTVKDLQYGGLSAMTGVDFSNSMGVGAVLGDADHPVNMLMPGATALGQMATSTAKMVTSPSVTNAKRFVMDAVPGGQLLERQMFSKQTPAGEEMGINRNSMEAMPVRTGMDKFAKQIGMTGRNEANTKNKIWENRTIEKVLAEKQKAAVDKMKDEFYESGTISKSTIDKYKKVEGSVENLDKLLNQMVLDQNIPSDVRDKIKAAAAQGLAGVGKMKRRFH